MNPREVLRAAESARGVDRPAGALATAARRLVRGRLDRLLRGSWLGHPVHPLLVTLPIGAWVSAAVLDCRGQREAARNLVALGLAATPPTVLAGLADFGELGTEQRRVGLLHAAGNGVTAVLFLASYACRARRHDTAGIVLSTLGLATLSASGALGGHLSYAQGAGVYRWERPEPADGPNG